MDAPRSRYRVVEKDGRLIVIDNGMGAPISSTSALPPPARGPRASLAPVVAGKGAIDSAADFLLHFAVKEWDAERRAVIRWTWKEKGRVRRWDALLDGGQQRRLGRALLGLCAIPLLVLAFVLLDGVMMWLGIILSVPLILRSFQAIGRLQSETAGQSPAEG